MSISDHTINTQYEYRIANIVRKLLIEEVYIPVDGDALESFLLDNYEKLGDMLADDIQEWMGFDELLNQVKGE